MIQTTINGKTNYIILQYKKIKFVLTTPKFKEPAVDTSKQIKITYQDWQKVNTLVCCYILANVVS